MTADHNMWGSGPGFATGRQPAGWFHRISHFFHNVWHGVTNVVHNVVHDVVDVVKTVADVVAHGGIEINRNVYDHTFGVNYNPSTHSALQPWSLLRGADGSVTCADCFAYVDLTAHVVLDATLTHFNAEVTLSGTGDMHIVADMDVQGSVGLQHRYGPLITFHVSWLTFVLSLFLFSIVASTWAACPRASRS
jgi:hypothetical protein